MHHLDQTTNQSVLNSWSLVRYWLKRIQRQNLPYVIPEPTDAILYTITEVGEVIDAWLRMVRPEDSRANSKKPDIAGELADVFIMAAHVLEKWPDWDVELDTLQSHSGLQNIANHQVIVSLQLLASAAGRLADPKPPHTTQSEALEVMTSATDTHEFLCAWEGATEYDPASFCSLIEGRLTYRTNTVCLRNGTPATDALDVIIDLMHFHTTLPGYMARKSN